VSVGITNPPQPPTCTSHEAKHWVNDPLGLCTKEGDGKEGEGEGKREGKEEKRGEGEVEAGEGEGKREGKEEKIGEGEVEAGDKQAPGRPLPSPPPTDDDRTQGNAKRHRQQ
jgi:hypothetical protein